MSSYYIEITDYFSNQGQFKDLAEGHTGGLAKD